MCNITVILPVHEVNGKKDKMLIDRAVESFNSAKNEEAKLLVVTTPELKNEFSEYDCDIITTVEGESTGFSHLVNLGVKNIDTEYFSILEFDDVIKKNAFVNFAKYKDSGFDASVYMCLTEAIDYMTNETFGYFNEGVYARSFSEELGYLDLECIKDYVAGINLTGAIFNKEDFIEVGGLKESMKLHFWLEFAMRAMYNKKKLFIVPKIGYLHTVNREDSFYGKLSGMSYEENDWWYDLACNEYIYKNDRNKQYE